MEINKLVRKNIQQLQPYSSARDEYSDTSAVLLDANENPFATGANRYPDPHQREVKKLIGEIKEVDEAQIFLGNGSDEAIDLILRVFCDPGKDNIITTNPTYGMYEVSARINDIDVLKVPLSEDFELDPKQVLGTVNEKTKIIFLCSPNNPSGNLLDREAVLNILESFEGIVVIDEAYIDFTEATSYVKKINDFPNLVILQTFSKAWGMAGVRLGMAIANPQITGLLNKIKPPYNINTLTQQFMLSHLNNRVIIQDKTRMIIKQRELLNARLKGLKIVKKVFPSDSNFLLVRFDNALKVFNYLLNKKIIIRDRTSVLYGENCLRITVGTSEENDKLITALKEL